MFDKLSEKQVVRLIEWKMPIWGIVYRLRQFNRTPRRTALYGHVFSTKEECKEVLGKYFVNPLPTKFVVTYADVCTVHIAFDGIKASYWDPAKVTSYPNLDNITFWSDILCKLPTASWLRNSSNSCYLAHEAFAEYHRYP